MKTYKETTIIIPTLNEEESVGRIIRKLKELYPLAEIIIADDGSKDKTQENAAKDGAKILDRTNMPIKGLTASVMDAARMVETENTVVIDADMQHPPEKIKEINDKLKKYLIVTGTRTKIVGEWGIYRKIMSKVATILGQIRLMRRVKCKDLMSGFFGVKTIFFQEIIRKKEKKFEKKGYKVLFDLLKIVKRGTPIGSVEYEFNIRKAGESKIGKKQIIYYLKSLFK